MPKLEPSTPSAAVTLSTRTASPSLQKLDLKMHTSSVTALSVGHMTKLVFYSSLPACLIDTRWPNTAAHARLVSEVWVSDVLTGRVTHLNVVCVCVCESWWMYLCFPLLFFEWALVHFIWIIVFISLFFFFFFCYSSSVAITWVYFSLWYNQNKSPTEGLLCWM